MKFKFLNILWFVFWVYPSAEPININAPSNKDNLKKFLGI